MNVRTLKEMKKINKSVLKEEAVKWVNKLAKDMEIDANEIKDCKINEQGIFQYSFEGSFGENSHEDCVKAMIAWIKCFFGLEDE